MKWTVVSVELPGNEFNIRDAEPYVRWVEADDVMTAHEESQRVLAEEFDSKYLGQEYTTMAVFPGHTKDAFAPAVQAVRQRETTREL